MEKAIEFLLKRTGHQDEATAKTLAEALGRLPLALEQAGAYIETSGCAMAHYLELFEKRQAELLHRGKPSTEYPDTVATTWSISFHKVESEDPAAAELLRLCAFFAPDDIPIKMLIAGADDMPESLAATASDALLLDEALMALRKYSLSEVDNETISIHRLVQAVLRHGLDDEAFRKWTGVAVHIVSTSFPQESGDVRTWPSVAIRLNNLGATLVSQGDLAPAKAFYERALAIDEAVYGPKHPAVARELNNLGLLLKKQGDLDGAKALYLRSLQICREFLGDDHPNTRTAEKNLRLLEGKPKNAE